jgi:hypothetical protein
LPARGESGPEAPEGKSTEKASILGIFGKSRRRTRKQGAEQDSAQGSLFDDSRPPQSAAAPEPRDSREAAGPDDAQSAAGKKSRSKRRRERRKAAKAAAADGSKPQQAARPQQDARPQGGAEDQQRRKGQKQEPKAQHKAPRPAGDRGPGERQKSRAPSADGRRTSAEGRGQQRGRADDRRPRTQRDQRDQGGKPGRRAQAYREKRRPDGGGRGQIEGLPPLSAEDLEAVAQTGYSEGPVSRYASSDRYRSRGAPSIPIPNSIRKLETLTSSSACLAALEALEGVLDEAVPLTAKHRAELRGDIRRLWEELTSEKESRSAEYLGTPPALSAYLRYFLPWNVFRLASILSNADFCLPDKAVIADIGSGPLTFPIALWISRPELREVPLTIYCMDRVERVMESGLAIFETLCMRVDGRLPPWRIELRKESFGAPLPEKAQLLTAANVFNEFFWKDKRSLGERALDTARGLLSYTTQNGSLFVMEPGDPRSGAFITALRAALIAEGAAPLGPCPHSLSCPMPGIFRHLLPPEETRAVKGDPNAAPSRFVLPTVVMPKKRDKYPWCHFGIDALAAPAWLEALSEEAGLPKERAVLSYLWAARGVLARAPVGLPPEAAKGSDRDRRARAGRGILVRVVSDPFALPDGSSGQYACSSIGYTMLKLSRGEEAFASGDLLEVTTSSMQKTDDKSGAAILTT